MNLKDDVICSGKANTALWAKLTTGRQVLFSTQVAYIVPAYFRALESQLKAKIFVKHATFKTFGVFSKLQTVTLFRPIKSL